MADLTAEELDQVEPWIQSAGFASVSVFRVLMQLVVLRDVTFSEAQTALDVLLSRQAARLRAEGVDLGPTYAEVTRSETASFRQPFRGGCGFEYRDVLRGGRKPS